MSGAVSGEQRAGPAQQLRGTRRIPASGANAARAVAGLCTVRAPREDGLVDFAALLPVSARCQSFGQLQLRGQVIRIDLQGLIKRLDSFAVSPGRRLHPAKVIEPLERVRLERARPLVTRSGIRVLLVGVEHHSELSARGGFARMSSRLRVSFENLLANGREGVRRPETRQRWQLGA